MTNAAAARIIRLLLQLDWLRVRPEIECVTSLVSGSVDVIVQSLRTCHPDASRFAAEWSDVLMEAQVLSGANLIETCLHLLTCNSYEVQLAVLQRINALLTSSPANQDAAARRDVIESELLREELMRIIESQDSYHKSVERSLQVLANILAATSTSTWENSIQRKESFVRRCWNLLEHRQDSVRCAALHLWSFIWSSHSPLDDVINLTSLADKLESLSTSSSSFESRAACATFLLRNSHLLDADPRDVTRRDDVMRSWTLLVRLFEDEDDEVRRIVSKCNFQIKTDSPTSGQFFRVHVYHQRMYCMY